MLLEASGIAESPSSRMFGSSSMNMRSAFMHVGADLLRSMVTVTEGLGQRVRLVGGRSHSKRTN